MADDGGEAEWRWFPPVKTDWSLDVVGLLAVIGESSIEEQTQAITASLFGMLPRILPAPQVFLKPTRPGRMPETAANVTGVHSGITVDSMGYFANIITPLDEEPVMGFKVIDIEHAQKAVPGTAAEAATKEGRFAAEEEEEEEGKAFIRRFIRAVLRVGGRGEGRKRKQGGDDEDAVVVAERRRPHQGTIAPDVEVGIAGNNSSPAAYSTARDSTAAAGATTTTTTTTSSNGPQKPRPARRMQSQMQDFFTSPADASKGERPAVPPALYSPIHILGVASCLVSIAIVVAAVIWQDGNAIISIGLISLVSTIVGAASFWRPILMKRSQRLDVPPGDVIIRTREGAFVLIRCTEDVARELYSGTEECEYYVSERLYRLLMALGTVLLMISIVLLGNCTWNSQVFIGGSYIVLNGLYWCLGMLPRSSFWDLSRYKWRDATPDDARRANRASEPNDASWVDDSERLPSFTRTLWYAIRETKRTDWVRTSGAAPATDAWRAWLAEAEENAILGNRLWNAVERKNVLMRVDKVREEERYQAVSRTATPTASPTVP